MASLVNTTGKLVCELIEKGVKVNPYLIPSCHAQVANELRTNHNWLFYVPGGLGDAVCAEPTIRYVLENFKKVKLTHKFDGNGKPTPLLPADYQEVDMNVSVVTYHPELFQHLKLREVLSFHTHPVNIKEVYKTHFILKTLYNPDYIHSDFVPHMFTHCVDYVSQVCIRMQLPIEQRMVKLVPSIGDVSIMQSHVKLNPCHVVVHPGRSWDSKTFPREWWNALIDGLIEKGFEPVIIGTITDQLQGTVNVKTKGCLDLRNKLTVMETTALLQKCGVLITNDSGPMHLAASGPCQIALISTAKRPDYLMHYRFGQLGYGMKNFSLGGVWERINMNPTNSDEMNFAEVFEGEMDKWLPNPEVIVNWTEKNI